MVRFTEPTIISSPEQVRDLRSQWTQALSSWHSPYKAIVDCTFLEVQDSGDVRLEFERFLTYLRGFFLRSIVGHAPDNHAKKGLPFEVLSEAEARKKVGLDKAPTGRNDGDFRSQIQIQNDFRNHVIEVTFRSLARAESKSEVEAFRSKLTNNLMQWHSGWNLLIDCRDFYVAEPAFAEFEKMLKTFKSFFMKGVLGYSPQSADAKYPFKVYRSRHNAVARLESEGMLAGDKADCKSRKVP